MKRMIYILLIHLLFGFSSPFSVSYASEDTLTQLSTIDALLEGYYDGFYTVLELKEKGDFGIGTVDGLDGELVVVDGKFFHITIDGKAYELTDTDTIPFADLLFFESQKNITLAESVTLQELYSFLDANLLSENVFSAFKIKGVFKKIKVRSVPKQEKPYKKLKEIVVSSQKVYEYENVTGTLIGFKSPPWVTKIGVAGYHFHFIDSEFKFGGHVLSLETGKIDMEIMSAHNFELMLPATDAFYQMDLKEDKQSALKVVETKSK